MCLDRLKFDVNKILVITYTEQKLERTVWLMLRAASGQTNKIFASANLKFFSHREEERSVWASHINLSTFRQRNRLLKRLLQPYAEFPTKSYCRFIDSEDRLIKIRFIYNWCKTSLLRQNIFYFYSCITSNCDKKGYTFILLPTMILVWLLPSLYFSSHELCGLYSLSEIHVM